MTAALCLRNSDPGLFFLSFFDVGNACAAIRQVLLNVRLKIFSGKDITIYAPHTVVKCRECIVKCKSVCIDL